MLKASEIRKMVAVPIFFALRGFFRSGLILLLFLSVAAPALAQSGTWSTLASMATARYGAAAGVIDGKIHVASGISALGTGGGIWTNTTEVYDPSTNTWSTKSPIPIRTEEGAAGVINGKLYVAGGSSSQYGGNIAFLQIYDPVTNAWTYGASMPSASHHMAAGVIDGKLYVAGGTDPSNNNRTNSLWVYDPLTNTWTTKASMPTTRFAAAAGVINEILYVVGGDDGPQYIHHPTNKVEAYDPATDTWTTKRPMPTSRLQHSVAVINGILYALGGWGYDGNGNQVIYDTVEAYDPVSDTWTISPPMPTARIVPSAEVINGVLYVFGGVNSNNNVLAINEAFTFNQLSGTWTTLAQMPDAAQASSGGVYNGELYVVSYPDRSLQIYNPQANTWTRKAADPLFRTYTAAGFIDGKLYVADGAINGDWNNCTNTLKMYDPAPNTYSDKASSPTPRATASYGVIGGKLYVAGGNGGGGNLMNLLEVYDPAANNWTNLVNMPIRQRQAGSAVVDGKLYVIGGYDRCDSQSCSPTGRVQVYDPATNTWTQKAPMPTPRHSPVCAVLNGIIYCIGGGDPVGYLNTVEAYNPASNTWMTSTPMPTARAGMVAGVIGGVIYVAGGTNNSGAVKVLEAFTPNQPSMNHPPVLDLIGNKDGREWELLEFTVTASDPNAGDSLTLGISNMPAGATFTTIAGNPVRGVFSWRPNYDQAGIYPNIIFTVTDNGNPPASASEAITITVGNVNRPPALSSIGNREIAENQTFQFTVNGADPDGDLLAFTAGNLPAGASFDPSTRTFIWTPTLDQTGSYQSIIFTVTDSSVPPASASESITITVSNVNRPPVLSSIGGKMVNEGETLRFTVTAMDPDGDQLIYATSNLPPGATFDPDTQKFSWTPTLDQAGTYPDVEFTVIDNWQPHEIAVELITITVGNVNRAPVFTPVGVKSVNEWDTLRFSVSATDYDGNLITYSASNLPAGATFDPGAMSFTWTPTANQAGSYTVVFYARDNDPWDPKEGQLEVAISVSVPTPLDLGKDIEDNILAINLPAQVFNSYWGNVKKVRPFIEKGNFIPAVNQLSAFINKVANDIAQGKISQADGNRLIAMASELIQILGY